MQWKEAKNFDFNLGFVIMALTIIGLLNLYSATHGQSTTGISRMFLSQATWMAIGWFIFVVVSLINYSFIKYFVWLIYFVNLGFLASVKYFGKSFLGAQRWLDFGVFRFQPSETMKIALVLVLALVFARHLKKESLSISDLILPAIVTIIPFALTVTQPDLGTALIMLIILGSMVLYIGLSLRLILTGLVLLCLAAPLTWSFGMKAYQKQRVLNFLNPGKDLRGGGYNSRQSKIAVGSGNLFGRGYMQGTQSQLEFLPERHTDFIFSVLSEEHGFIGSVLTVILFFLLFISILRVAQSTDDNFGSLICIGVGTILFWHFFINVGMVIGLLPVVGVPLPLLSYGGSSLVTTMGSLGLVSSISLKRFLF